MKDESDLALRPPVINTSPGQEYADDTRIFQGIPGIERSPAGRLWALWYGGGDGETGENYVMVVTSADDGRKWSPVRMVIDPPFPVRAFDPCLWMDPGGHLWLFWAQSYQHFDGRAGVWAIVSENPDVEDPSWSEPRHICNGIMMNKPIVASSGQWLLPVTVWEWSERTDIPHEEKNANVIASTDEGKTWSLLGGVERAGDGYCEHMVVEKEDGRLWMLIRGKFGIGESYSEDGGITWTKGRPFSIKHTGSRFFIRRLNSGNLILVKHGPIGAVTDRSHLTAYLSEDDGNSWSCGLLLDERLGVSYPDGVQSPEGKVYIIYDYQRKGAKQILMSTFNEDDLRSGAFNSGNAGQRILVNQAGTQ
jgi:predicted neuraminidase